MAGPKVSFRVMLGAEVVAQAALDAGISAAYAYPGTPSTEIMEFILHERELHTRRDPDAAQSPRGGWCANEKTAYEAAMGVSMAGRRALVSMKHVGLNVAMDPYVNSALVTLGGGLVLAVADDPGMYSSQNEQDSRVIADFAHAICFEPADQQQAYDMTREAYEVSERFHIPVMIRLVTCLAHSRTSVRLDAPIDERPLSAETPRDGWVLLPANARRLWKGLLARQTEFVAWSEASRHNVLELSPLRGGLGVITTGVARNHYFESADELAVRPSHLHIGTYPIPMAKVRQLAEHVDRILVLEDGYPFVERLIGGTLPRDLKIAGRLTGAIPEDGELNPDLVRRALGLAGRHGIVVEGLALPPRPPQLCQGCPHRDSYDAIKSALAAEGAAHPIVAGDIGCYTLGALPPYRTMESCLCMGASIGMARGAAAAGLSPALAVIGDSTFLHSGVTSLMDAVAENAHMTVVILDNEAVGMTGAQPTVLPDSRLEPIVRGVGVDPDHIHVQEAHPRCVEQMTALLRKTFAHPGLSVVIFVRQCIPAAKKTKAAAAAQS
ncbi:MAG: indolepyruvate ferredoxin oxidoreductase [Planctomycetes bacterium]|nr:indolepyruvate ferredoxin oxidoreductase [Planctomycetota bacterium]